jgi:hypothetical protein
MLLLIVSNFEKMLIFVVSENLIFTICSCMTSVSNNIRNRSNACVEGLMGRHQCCSRKDNNSFGPDIVADSGCQQIAQLLDDDAEANGPSRRLLLLQPLVKVASSSRPNIQSMVMLDIFCSIFSYLVLLEIYSNV